MAKEFRGRILRAQLGTLLIERKPGAGAAMNVEFDAVRNLDRTPNTATLHVYNLNAEHRKQIESMTSKDVCSLELGYETTGLFEAYRGNVVISTTVRQEAHLITTVELTDGDGETSGRYVRSYASGTKISAILRDIARQNGMKPGNLDAILAREPGLANAKLDHSLTIRSEGARALSDAVGATGFSASVQSGVLQVVRAQEGLEGQAVLLSAGTGLLGSPTVALDKKKRVVTAESRMQAGLEPGRQVKIESLSVSGMHVVQRAQYSGSIDGDQFSVSIEAQPF